MFPALINPTVTILVSAATATGVFVHDTRIDKAAMTAVSAPAVMAAYEANTKQTNLSPDLHPHSERGSLSQAVHDLKTQNPRIQPRAEEKKHLMQKRVAKGHHAFDNYNLPIV